MSKTAVYFGGPKDGMVESLYDDTPIIRALVSDSYRTSWSFREWFEPVAPVDYSTVEYRRGRKSNAGNVVIYDFVPDPALIAKKARHLIEELRKAGADRRFEYEIRGLTEVLP